MQSKGPGFAFQPGQTFKLSISRLRGTKIGRQVDRHGEKQPGGQGSRQIDSQVVYR